MLFPENYAYLPPDEYQKRYDSKDPREYTENYEAAKLEYKIMDYNGLIFSFRNQRLGEYVGIPVKFNKKLVALRRRRIKNIIKNSGIRDNLILQKIIVKRMGFDRVTDKLNYLFGIVPLIDIISAPQAPPIDYHTHSLPPPRPPRDPEMDEPQKGGLTIDINISSIKKSTSRSNLR